MLVSGRMTDSMDREEWFIQMEQLRKEFGRITISKARSELGDTLKSESIAAGGMQIYS